VRMGEAMAQYAAPAEHIERGHRSH